MPVAPDALVEWLAEELEERNLSPNEASIRAGLSRNSIATYLNGTRPGFYACVAVARLFREPPEYVLRLAGHLPSVPEPDALTQRLMHLILDMSPAQRAELYTYVRYLADHPYRDQAISEFR